ncbi:murein DD-endopeptidase MepM/ murein hydrolase activator NlpD [Kocuria rhizophila]|uniref:peptidoglycan DD-metalloendopeptidase family protein n=1 Tax=Kocuria rhizophila TaxID=72000 RepID=UPI002019933F|nr:peptidoglycan DD-metalloendopeptidase family protein [Kocuria rhizophila]MDR7375221.1 murein DD-endopeptidase MepM/ murein hydrolase activator NlpD [Kocuria rhizophila]
MSIKRKVATAVIVKWVGIPGIVLTIVVLGLVALFAAVMTFMGVGSAAAKDQHDTQVAASNEGGTCKASGSGGKGGGVQVPKEFQGPIKDAAKESGLPEQIVAAQINQESQFSTGATSSVGAQGPAQFMPATWETYGNGGNPRDVKDAMAAYGRYMKHLLSTAKGWETKGGTDAARLAVAAYNAGEAAPGLSEGKLPPYEETQNYVKVIFEGAQDKFSVDCEQVAGQGVSEVELGDGEWAKPLPGGQKTSGYGPRHIIDCAPGDYTISNGCHANYHLGYDIATPAGGKGGTVVAPTDAVVVCAPGLAFEGMVQLRVENGKDSKMLINFMHMSSNTVKEGQKVKRGDPIGVEGNVGQLSMAKHLHLEIMKPGTHDCAKPWENGKKDVNVDPEPILKEKGAV